MTNHDNHLAKTCGNDPATGHAKPGWAIEMGFEAACELSLRFQQDAIFWVSGNRVWVAKCGVDRQRTAIGLFADRFELEAMGEPAERESAG